MGENTSVGVWESRGEVPAHCWGNNIQYSDTLKSVRGMISLFWHHISSKVALLSAKRHLLSLLLLPLEKMRMRVNEGSKGKGGE